MLAHFLHDALVHDRCGHFLPESTDPANADRYHVEPPTRCYACTARDRAVKAHLEAPHAGHPEALLWPVERR